MVRAAFDFKKIKANQQTLLHHHTNVKSKNIILQFDRLVLRELGQCYSFSFSFPHLVLCQRGDGLEGLHSQRLGAKVHPMTTLILNRGGEQKGEEERSGGGEGKKIEGKVVKRAGWRNHDNRKGKGKEGGMGIT